MAWVRIAVYRLSDSEAGIERDEAVRLTRESAVPLVRGLAGFVDYELVEVGDAFMAISHWQSREHAEAMAEPHEAWRQAEAPALPRPAAVYIGEVVIPRQGS